MSKANPREEDTAQLDWSDFRSFERSAYKPQILTVKVPQQTKSLIMSSSVEVKKHQAHCGFLLKTKVCWIDLYIYIYICVYTHVDIYTHSLELNLESPELLYSSICFSNLWQEYEHGNLTLSFKSPQTSSITGFSHPHIHSIKKIF